MPADPFTQLGISRRPSNVIFGTAPVTQRSAPAWSRATIQDAADESAALEEAQVAEDVRMAAARKRAAEDKVDQFEQLAPSSRQRFLEEEGPGMVSSPRYNEITQMQKYADDTLVNSVATKMTDPDARQVFINAVAAGHGTLVARDMAEDHVFKKKQAGRLAEAGFAPDEQDQALAKRHDDAHVNYLITQKKEGTMFHRDPQAQAAEKIHQILLRRAEAERHDHTTPFAIRAETAAETAAKLKDVEGFLEKRLYEVWKPIIPAASPAGQKPLVPLTTDQAATKFLEDRGMIKKPAATKP